MRRIAQMDPEGCGVACVAMLAKCSYKRARDILFPEGQEVRATKHDQLRAALKELGVHLGPGRRLSQYSYCDLGVDGLLRVRVKKGSREPWWHWMVWDAKSSAILDPYNGPLSNRFWQPSSFFEAQRT